VSKRKGLLDDFERCVVAVVGRVLSQGIGAMAARDSIFVFEVPSELSGRIDREERK
jgi:hypothetical protein